jgi:hypothetical protein
MNIDKMSYHSPFFLVVSTMIAQGGKNMESSNFIAKASCRPVLMPRIA